MFNGIIYLFTTKDLICPLDSLRKKRVTQPVSNGLKNPNLSLKIVSLFHSCMGTTVVKFSNIFKLLSLEDQIMKKMKVNFTKL